jgi:uncharacterized repeat protein (TIGR01451 family)
LRLTAVFALTLAIAAIIWPVWVLAQETDTGSAAPQSLGSLQVQIEAMTATTPLAPGDIVTYTINLRRVGGASPVTASLTNTLPAAMQIGPAGSIQVTEVSPNVAPLRVGFGDGALRWRGGLSPDAHLRIRYLARVRNCFAYEAITVESGVTAQIDGGTLQSDAAALAVDCDGAAPSQVSVSHDFVAALPGGETADSSPTSSLHPLEHCDPLWACRPLTATLRYVGGVRTFWRVTAVNDSNKPAALKLAAEFPGVNFLASPAIRGLESTTLGWTGCLTCPLALDEQAPVRQGYLLRLAPGETRHFLARLGAPDEDALEVEQRVLLGYCLTDDGQHCPGEGEDAVVPPDSVQWLASAAITPQHRDLGDAPDSSNHSGAAMAAYPGVAAAFPTVFDPATGLPQGPAHLDPRPFHLGRRVSPEAEADAGPDLDPTHNILPNANIPNRDRGDDGVALYQTGFTRCATTTIPIRALIAPAAVAYFQENEQKGYVNVWLDGNRDGDWADGVQCPGVAQPALEHIVIDHPIDAAALGPGLHTILAPTGPAPWPDALAARPSWIRVTLSEAPSHKPLTTGGVAHGDGRGFAAPFAYGETEDYLYLPPGASGAGADVAVAQTAWATYTPDPGDGGAGLMGTDAGSRSFSVNFKIDYGNEGTEAAENVSITALVNDRLAERGELQVAYHDQGDLTWTRTGNEVRFDRGYLPPGVRGTVVLRWKVEEGESLAALFSPQALPDSGVFTNTVTVSGDNDLIPGNDTAVATAEVGPPAPSIGFRPQGSQYLHSSGLTCDGNLTVEGTAVPNATVRVFANGLEIAETTADTNGNYSVPFILPNGVRGRIRAQAEANGRTSPLSDALFVGVNDDLPWDPSTFFFVSETGQAYAAFDGKGNDVVSVDDWAVRLDPALEHTVILRYCGDDAAPSLSLQVGEQEIPLTDEDGDSFYEGVYTSPATHHPQAAAAGTPLTLRIESDDVDYTYTGEGQPAPAGQVYDAQDGTAIAGAAVSLLQALPADDGAGNGGYGLWEAAAYGQQNPLTSDGAGAYNFAPIPGVYRLRAARDGYQPYVSPSLNARTESVNRPLPLTPLIAESPHYVVGIDADGFTPSVLRAPRNAVIEWVNVGAAEHTAASSEPLLTPGTAGNGGWDSGVLATGASYRLRLTEAGTYTYTDAANPLHTATIVIDDSLPGPYGNYLPLVVQP